MPPKQKITKEMILQSSYELVVEAGIEQVNSRNVAQRMNCSTQPIFSYFSTMEELRQAVHDYACQKLEAEVLCIEDNKDFIRHSYLKVIDLARKLPNVFFLIYLSKYCIGSQLLDIRIQYQSNQKIVHEIEDRYGIPEKQAMDVLERISIFVQGLASLIATSNIRYSDDEVIRITEQTLEDFTRRQENK